MIRNIQLYPYFQAARFLLFWQAGWFLYFEQTLSGAEALLLAACFDIGTVIIEVPSGYLSDWIGRRRTLIASMTAAVLGCLLLYAGSTFASFLCAQGLLGASVALASGTDNALLYESLSAEGRESEVAAQESKAIRLSMMALSLSAATGGLLSLISFPLTYLATALASAIALVIAIRFKEPVVPQHSRQAHLPMKQLKAVGGKLRDPVLCWMLVFAAVSLVLEDVPYVYLQPFLREALSDHGLDASAPVVTGFFIAAIMGVSAILGGLTPVLRRRLSEPAILLAMMAVQLVLVWSMALIFNIGVLAILLLRMVPSTIAYPLQLHIIQPRLSHGIRATYLSLQNLVSRLTVSGTVLAAAWVFGDSGLLGREDLVAILISYAIGGIVMFGLLAAIVFALRNNLIKPGSSGGF